MNLRRNEFPKRGEIWIANYNFKFSDLRPEGKNFTIESPIKKNRPCIVISNDMHNELSDWIFIVPLTSDNIMELEEPLEVLVSADGFNNLNEDSKALVMFTNFLDKNHRLKKFIGSASEGVMKKITRSLTSLVS